jgi:hypothetical protein
MEWEPAFVKARDRATTGWGCGFKKVVLFRIATRALTRLSRCAATERRTPQKNSLSLEQLSAAFARHPIQGARDTMTRILLATAAIVAFATPSFAQREKTTGQAPPSGASSFYLAQDTATMKCQIVNAQPATGGHMKVIGMAHRTQAEAQTALAAEKTCAK